MIYNSLFMTLIVDIGVIIMLVLSKKIGGGASKYFVKQQKAIGESFFHMAITIRIFIL